MRELIHFHLNSVIRSVIMVVSFQRLERSTVIFTVFAILMQIVLPEPNDTHWSCAVLLN